MLKDEQHQAVLSLPEQKDVVVVLPAGFAKSLKLFDLAVVRRSETQTKRKERGIVVASPLQSIINDQVEAMREAGISIITLPCRRTTR